MEKPIKKKQQDSSKESYGNYSQFTFVAETVIGEGIVYVSVAAAHSTGNRWTLDISCRSPKGITIISWKKTYTLNVVDAIDSVQTILDTISAEISKLKSESPQLIDFLGDKNPSNTPQES